METSTGRRGGLIEGRVLIGRLPTNGIVLGDSNVSRLHAWVDRIRDRFYVADTGSLTGTKVNGQPVDRRAPLHNGDRIGIGKAVVSFHDVDVLPPDVTPIDLAGQAPAANVAAAGVLFECVCGAPVWFKSTAIGQHHKCRHCGAEVEIPAASGARATLVASPAATGVRDPAWLPETVAAAAMTNEAAEGAFVDLALDELPLATPMDGESHAGGNGQDDHGIEELAVPLAVEAGLEMPIEVADAPVAPATVDEAPLPTAPLASTDEADVPTLTVPPPMAFEPTHETPSLSALMKPAAPIAFDHDQSHESRITESVFAPAAEEATPAEAAPIAPVVEVAAPAAASATVAAQPEPQLEPLPAPLVGGQSSVHGGLEEHEVARMLMHVDEPPHAAPAVEAQAPHPIPNLPANDAHVEAPPTAEPAAVAMLADGHAVDEAPVDELTAEPVREQTCSVCHNSIFADEARTSCPSCGLTFHAECWEENRGCSAYGCPQVGALEPAHADAHALDYAHHDGHAAEHATSPHTLLETAYEADTAFPWEFLFLASSVLGILLSVVTFGVPALIALLGTLAYRVRYQTHSRRRVIVTVALVLCIIGIGVGVATSYYWWFRASVGKWAQPS